MKKILFAFFICSFYIISAAFAQQTHTTAPFDEIVATGNVLIELVAGEEESVKTKKNDEDLKVEVSAGVLRIRRKKMYDFKVYKKDETIKVKVVYQELRSITGNAGASFDVSRALKGDQLTINLNSGASGSFPVAVNSLKLQSSEGAHLSVSGTSKTLDVKSSSGGKIDAYDLVSVRTYAKTHTAGEAKVTAQKYLEAHASTGGTIIYKGNPGELSIKDDLGGKVEKEGQR